MTDPMTTQSAGAPSLPELPKVPEPWTAASTLKCTACGAPYESVRALAPMAGAACLGGYVPAHACKCGNTQFDGTVSYDSPSPAQFTAAHMRDFATTHGLACYEAGSAAAAQAVPEGFVLVPREPTFEMNKAGQEAVWDFHPDDTIEGNEETARAAYFAMLAAAPTQGAEGAAPQAVVAERDFAMLRFPEMYDGSQAVAGEASGVAVRSRALADEVLLALESYSNGGTDKEQLAEDWSSGLLPKVYDTLNLFAALTPSPTPTAPQEADALREALKLALKALEAIGDEMTVGERYTNAGQYLLDALEPARAALAQHQPQQGEQHE
jgi:hypothetical protein